MDFCTLLNNYIEQLSCSAKELSEASMLSNSVISRYRSGEREPAADSEQLIKIVNGLYSLATKNGISSVANADLLTEFQQTLTKKVTQSAAFAKKFNLISELLQINMKELSIYTNFETSYLYRIRSGQRNPNNIATFVDKLCRYITINHNDISSINAVAKLLNCSSDELADATAYATHLAEWISDDNIPLPASDDTEIASFLSRFDNFNLEEYIRSIHFDELKIPIIPFYKTSSKHYYGIEDMKKGELDFFKATVLSKSKEPIYMCSDMPMVDMAEDMEFNKKWMFGIAMALKKGLHINIIHNIDRPFAEMMLGLEAWIPIYMTGQVSPYHLPNITTNIYHHFTYVSGSVALTGECINGFHDNGKYYLASHKEEVTYYKQRAKDLFSKAKPLLDIYRSDRCTQYQSFLSNFAKESGTRHYMLSAPPIYTISDDLLNRIFNRLATPSNKQEAIRSYVSNIKKNAKQILNDNKINIRLSHISKEEFDAHPVALSLSGLFEEQSICYTYEEYLEHLELVKSYEKANTNFSLKLSDKLKFRNIQVQILDKKCIVISKEKSPAIHFVIRHRKMVDALYNFYLFES